MATRINEAVTPSGNPTHVVALSDYVPGESEIDFGATRVVQAPHIEEHLSFLKGNIFKLVGDANWWLYVTSSDGKTGYIPSILTAPLNTHSLNPE